MAKPEHDGKVMEKAVKWDIVFCLRAAQAELPEQASTTCTAFALP